MKEHAATRRQEAKVKAWHDCRQMQSRGKCFKHIFCQFLSFCFSLAAVFFFLVRLSCCFAAAAVVVLL